jgi:hypothetical protein
MNFLGWGNRKPYSLESIFLLQQINQQYSQPSEPDTKRKENSLGWEKQGCSLEEKLFEDA